MWLYATALVVFILDQLVKVIILSFLSLGESLPVIPKILHLTLVRNTGIAFGFLKGNPLWLFIFISLSILVLIILSLKLYQASRTLQLAYGMILGGAASNYLDRIRFGSIVDYIDARVWPVFNLADMAISIGVGLFILTVWLRRR